MLFFSECLLHVSAAPFSISSRIDSGSSAIISLGDLALAVLQTEKNWDSWHACHFVLPEIETVGAFYSIKAKKADTADSKRTECRVQLQFDGEKAVCLGQEASSNVPSKASKAMLKLAIHSYDQENSMDFLSHVGHFGLFLAKGHRSRRQSPPLVRVTSSSFNKVACSDLVKILAFTKRPTVETRSDDIANDSTNDNDYEILNESLDKEDCVLKIHFPYGYATLLHFALESMGKSEKKTQPKVLLQRERRGSLQIPKVVPRTAVLSRLFSPCPLNWWHSE